MNIKNIFLVIAMSFGISLFVCISVFISVWSIRVIAHTYSIESRLDDLEKSKKLYHPVDQKIYIKEK